MQTLLDASAVLRYLLEDDQGQADEVASAIERGAEVTVEVLAECVYVLGDVYGVPRSGIAESLGLLLGEVTCRRKGVALAALGLFSGSSYDFVDCVLAAEHDVCHRNVLAFDDELASLLRMVE